MHDQQNAPNDKAAAARFQRKLVRSRSRRRVAFSSIALFALVFTLLSFRLTAGLDPSSSGNTVATTTTQSTQSSADTYSNGGSSSDSSGPGSGDDDDEYEYEYEYDDDDDGAYEEDDDDDDAGVVTSAPNASTAAPTTRAS